MKYLKLFKESSSDDIIQILKDIFIEINDIDERFSIFFIRPIQYDDLNIIPSMNNEEQDINIIIDKVESLRVSFYIEEVKEILLRMITFMNNNNYDAYIYSRYKTYDRVKNIILEENQTIKTTFNETTFEFNELVTMLQIKFRKKNN